MAMKSELQEMVQELEKAFNETVCESDRIAEVLAVIKASGYDVLLALEVTVGVTPDQRPAEEPSNDPAPARADHPISPAGELALTSDDREFLRALKIGE